MFSKRFHKNLTSNALFQLLERKKAERTRIIDLTESNPTRTGFHYDDACILEALSRPELLKYDPAPRGLAQARHAVKDYYRGNNLKVSADSVFLTASTSEAYTCLFKLLGDAGDEVLAPRPSYPLLESIAEMESLRLTSYALGHSPRDGWTMDLDALAGSISSKTRAVITVNPNNPTGSYVKAGELKALNNICSQYGLALIVDEVFLDYGCLKDDAQRYSAVRNTQAVTFVLSGFSKILALPQVKLGWIHLSGPDQACREAGEKLDFILDTYLSVNGPVQHGAAMLLEQRKEIQHQIRERLGRNSMLLADKVRDLPRVKLLKRDGGWYAVLKMSPDRDDEQIARQLLEKDNVLTHPGYFYDFTQEGHLVLSLLPEPGVFAEGAERMCEGLGRGL